MGKSHGFRGSLALRVLVISFVFVILPLVLYALLLFIKDYREEEEALFERLNYIQRSNEEYIFQLENSSVLFLQSLDKLLDILVDDKSNVLSQPLMEVLEGYVTRENLTAISVVQRGEETYTCRYSTNKAYINKRFTFLGPRTVKPIDYFIDDDLLFGSSLYIVVKLVQPILTQYIIASIALSTLIENLDRRMADASLDTTVMTGAGKVLATSNPPFEGKTFSFKPSAKSIELSSIKNVKNGIQFQGDVAYFGVLSNIPQTGDMIILSLPSRLVVKSMLEYMERLGIFLLFILVIGSIAAYLLTLRMSRPLKNLNHMMHSVGEGDLETRFSYDTFGFEINLLGEGFNQMLVSLKKTIEHMQIERAAREVFQKEMEIARQIQQSILPDPHYDDTHISIRTYFNPAKEVAGDYYDLLREGNRILITVADGVGKGVSSALYSFDLRSIVRSCFIRGDSLEDMVHHANKLFCEDTKDTGSFVTAFIGIIDTDKGILEFVNMGHEPPILLNAGHPPRERTERVIAFGVEDSIQVEVQEIPLQENETIFVYSDGLIDQKNKSGTFFGLENVMSVLENAPSDKIIDVLYSALQEFAEGEEQFDDITMMIITGKNENRDDSSTAR
ncbi:MAG: hypothetical protein A3F09_05155 [Chlamydiae bacterium RIFCSPHIGHO2_12_FULL_49_11]|nr:MAG: hypothetical protein A3F09_05155 [Chlamydiae bacterium RIFCSPHIGHO2_12_FULL_49_11]